MSSEYTIREIVDLHREHATSFPADGRVIEITGPRNLEVTVQLDGETIEIRSSQHSRLIFTSEGSNGLRIKPTWETL